MEESGLDIWKDVGDVLGGIAHEQEFPVETLEQRIKYFLVTRYGPGWLDCHVQEYRLGKQRLHVAGRWCKTCRSVHVHVVEVMPDGRLVLAEPVLNEE